MIKLFYNPQSRAVITLWLLEELGVDYELVPVAYEDGSMRTPEFLAVNPMGKIPAILDGDTPLSETVAIAIYLADKYKAKADLAPAIDDPIRAEYLKWLVFQAAAVEPAMLQANTKIEVPRQSAAWGDVELVLGVLEDRLAKADPWLFGDRFTAADVILGGALGFAVNFKMFPKSPAMGAYVDRLAQRPAFQRAFATQNS
jgi:glutathione S-transferase